MLEPQIIREDIVIIQSVEPVDSYGNMEFLTTKGKYKLNKKHEGLQPLILAGKQVKLGIAEYMKREYVHLITPMEEAVEGVYKEAVKELTKPPPKPQERSRSEEISEHVWYKELGEMLRAKDIDTKTPHGKLLRKAYYAQMFKVLGIESDIEL